MAIDIANRVSNDVGCSPNNLFSYAAIKIPVTIA